MMTTNDFLDLMDGLEPIDPKVLADFRNEMVLQVIPTVLQDIEKRRLLADVSRRWIIT